MKSFFSKRRIFEKWPRMERSRANELPLFLCSVSGGKGKQIHLLQTDHATAKWWRTYRCDCQLGAGSGTGLAAMGGYGAGCMQACQGWNLLQHQLATESLHVLLHPWRINVILSWDTACISYFSNRKSWRLWENWSGKGCFSLTWQSAKSSRTTGCVPWRLLPK